MDALCIMAECDRKGYLQTADGKPLAVDVLARLTGNTTEATSAWIAELEQAGVFSRTAEGVIFNRRMVRDATKVDRFTEYGKLGGNPALKAKDNPAGLTQGITQGDNGGVKPMEDPIPSTSTIPNSNTKPEAEKTPPTPKGEKRDKDRGFKTWTKEQFVQSVAEANANSEYTPDQIANFVECWLEPTSTGRFRFHRQDTWDTALRLKRALRMGYLDGRVKPSGASNGLALGQVDHTPGLITKQKPGF